MTARYNAFKEPKPAKSMITDGMSIGASTAPGDLAPGLAPPPGADRKQPNLSVDNCPNVVRGHKV